MLLVITKTAKKTFTAKEETQATPFPLVKQKLHHFKTTLRGNF